MNSKILIVEDDPAIRMLVKAVLEGDGHEVHEAADGLAALPAAREFRPDLVLLDIGLPGIDGFGVLDQLKGDAELREVPVMMVTAWAEPELVTRALDAGAYDYVRKPFDVGDLRRRVDAALTSAAAGDAATGLPGREQLSAALVERAERAHSVVLVALDGEQGDDTLLHAAGRRLAQRVRTADVLGRWGYTSFVVIVDTDLGGAGALAEDLRAALAERPVMGRRMTASIGVAAHIADETPEALLGRAASGVHAAQLAGHNGVQLVAGDAPVAA
jgi:two-component system cell cycle response regulator